MDSGLFALEEAVFLDRVWFYSKASLSFAVLLLQLPECWNYRWAPTHLSQIPYLCLRQRLNLQSSETLAQTSLRFRAAFLSQPLKCNDYRHKPP